MSNLHPLYGKEVYRWQIDEFDREPKTNRWYLVMGGLCLALIIYSVIVGNFLFALIILLFGFIII